MGWAGLQAGSGVNALVDRGGAIANGGALGTNLVTKGLSGAVRK